MHFKTVAVSLFHTGRTNHTGACNEAFKRCRQPWRDTIGDGNRPRRERASAEFADLIHGGRFTIHNQLQLVCLRLIPIFWIIAHKIRPMIFF